MNYGGLIEYKGKFISKVKKKSKNGLKNQKEKNDNVTSIAKFKDLALKESKFFNDIKVDTTNIDKYMDKKKFLAYINGNIEALKMLSVDRLRKLTEYYDGVIEKNNKKIEKLKKSI